MQDPVEGRLKRLGPHVAPSISKGKTVEALVEILSEIRPEDDFTASDNFVADGLLDSFDVVTLVSELDKKYSISIDGTEISPENFQNLDAIKAMVEKYGVSL